MSDPISSFGRKKGDRPDPDALLARIKKEQAGETHGQLKIFFGANAGVGKSYKMLQAAHQLKERQRIDVVVGYIELHGRKDTEALLEGLERLPPLSVSYKGRFLTEFDLDGALKRQPKLILVDEYAHTNAQGSRHPKRWQDVEELLNAGIDVWTTLNVQHLESFNDVIEQITGVRVQETLPDHVFELAEEVELIDLPPDELVQRLNEGKVYPRPQALKARENFFREGNLIALRELALRALANRVDAEMRAYRENLAIPETWPAWERILVCIGPDLQAEGLVRHGKRLATHLRAAWSVIYVETPKLLTLPEPRRVRALRALRLATQLGAQVEHASAPSVLGEVITYTKRNNMTLLVLGRTFRDNYLAQFWASLRKLLRPALGDALVSALPGVSVHIVSPESSITHKPESDTKNGVIKEDKYIWWPALATVCVCTALSWIAFPYLELVNLVMIYLAGVVFVAARYGQFASMLTVITGIAAFDFLFVPPRFSFAVSDTKYFITFIVMLIIGLLISRLATRARAQAIVAAERAQHAQALNNFARQLATARTKETVIENLIKCVHQTFHVKAAVLTPNESGMLRDPSQICRRKQAETTMLPAFETGFKQPLDPYNELSVAQWVFDHRRAAGTGTDTLAIAEGLYLPLLGIDSNLGVLALRPDKSTFASREDRDLIDALAYQAALALERAALAQQNPVLSKIL